MEEKDDETNEGIARARRDPPRRERKGRHSPDVGDRRVRAYLKAEDEESSFERAWRDLMSDDSER